MEYGVLSEGSSMKVLFEEQCERLNEMISKAPFKPFKVVPGFASSLSRRKNEPLSQKKRASLAEKTGEGKKARGLYHIAKSDTMGNKS